VVTPAASRAAALSDPPAFDPLRTVAGQLLPVPGVWVIDPGHSSVAFEARHMVVTRMRGRFRSFSGELHIADDPDRSWVEVSIVAASLDTTNEAADQSLKSDRFLDVERFPTLHFVSSAIHHVEGNRWQVNGSLTIRDISHPITLDTTFEGAVLAGRVARAKAAFVARGEFDRRDFGMDFNLPVPSGGWVVGNQVRLELDVEANLE
jgi:polyisoprenoid-binding protein YceI